MRTLNRPMFNMGGPIKQGVMHGIREPYKHGGKMLLVGQHPKEFQDKSGREKHLAPILMGIAHGARMALPWAARMGSRYLPKIKRMFGTTTPGSVTKGTLYSGRGVRGKKALRKLKKEDPLIAGPHQQVTMNPSKFTPNWLGRDPTVQLIGGAGRSIFNPTVGGWVGKGARFATSPTVIIGGLYFANGRWFNKDGSPAADEDIAVAQAKAGGVPGGGDLDMQGTGEWFKKEAAVAREAKAKADKEKRINDLLDTMGYDKARKNAAYDALIDAGRMVSERGTLDTKNIGRELIDPIVATTSQRFDKPEQIREAVGLMQVKADIAKQMEDPETKKLRRLQAEQAEKALAGNTLEETAEALFTRHGSWPSGEKLANLARNKGIAITDVIDTAGEEVGDPVAYMKGQIAQAIQDGNPVPPGNYVVDKAIIIIDAEGNVSRR